MKRWNSLLVAGLILGMLSNPLAARADEQGHGMILNSPHAGMLYLYVTPNGIALVFPKTGAKIVLHSPDWKVVMYNDKSKVYYIESMEEVTNLDTRSARRGRAQLARHASANSIRKGKTAPIANMNATQYLIHTMSDSGPKLAETWITQDFTPPKQLIDLLGKLFRIETANFPKGMPLRVKLSDDAGKRDLIFDTLKCETQMIKSASFSYPAGYKRVDNEIAVLVDEKSRKKMESILEDSDELSSILGPSTGSRPSSYRPTASSSGYSQYSRPTYTPRATTSAVKKPQSNDWWGNIMDTLSGAKK